MTTPTVTPRPADVRTTVPAPADDGLFGPESISWRLSDAPAAGVAILTAVLVQMLHPRVMWMINQASSFWEYPERRGLLTQRYGISTVYGDTATAEQAGKTLRLIHSRRSAIDPITGETYRADEPDLLLWVHCTIPWAILRACGRWGPAFTPEEEDRYVHEQKTAARLVGIDPDKAPGSVKELDAYMESMRPKLALTSGCLRLMALTVPRSKKPTAANVLQLVASQAAISLLTPEQRRLYGVRWTRWDDLATNGLTRVLLAQAAKKMATEDQVAKQRADAMAHPFGGHPRVTPASSAQPEEPAVSGPAARDT